MTCPNGILKYMWNAVQLQLLLCEYLCIVVGYKNFYSSPMFRVEFRFWIRHEESWSKYFQREHFPFSCCDTGHNAYLHIYYLHIYSLAHM